MFLNENHCFHALMTPVIFLNSVFFLHNGFKDVHQIETLKISLLENFADLFSMILMFRILDRKIFELVLKLYIITGRKIKYCRNIILLIL